MSFRLLCPVPVPFFFHKKKKKKGGGGGCNLNPFRALNYIHIEQEKKEKKGNISFQ